MEDSDFYKQTIQIIIYILGSISIISILLIIIVFIFEAKRKKATPAFELIFNLSLCELINTIAFIMLYFPDFKHKDYNKILCSIQGPVIFGSETSQHIMATIISLYILWINMPVNNIVQITNINEFFKENNNNKNFNYKNRLLYIFLSYGVSIVFSLIGVYFDIFGVNRFNCFIKQENEFIISIYYCIIWILIIINLLIAVKIYSMKFTQLEDREKIYRIEFSRGLSVYPIVNLVCFFIFTITNYLSFNDENSQKIVNIINLIFILLNGFFYALISMYSFRFRKKIMKLIKRFRFSRNKNHIEELNACDINDYLHDNGQDKESFPRIDAISIRSES